MKARKDADSYRRVYVGGDEQCWPMIRWQRRRIRFNDRRRHCIIVLPAAETAAAAAAVA